MRGDVAQSLAQGQPVDVEVDNRILPGQVARARLPLQVQRDVTAVPATAVLYDEGRAFVFLHSNGVLKKVEVQTGSRVGDLQVVLQGLDAADHVVMRDVAALSDGQVVEAVDATEAAVSTE